MKMKNIWYRYYNKLFYVLPNAEKCQIANLLRYAVQCKYDET